MKRNSKEMFKPLTVAQVMKMRKRSGLTQTAFWAKVGVGQSGGSRYESGRRIPKAVCALLRIAYGENVYWIWETLRT